MAEPLLLGAHETREKVTRGDALLVCAYDDRQRFLEVRLEGAIPLSELESRRTALSPEQQVVFYCA